MSYDRPPPVHSVRQKRSKPAERLLLPAAFITTAGNAFQITAAAILVFRAGQNTLSVGWLFIAVSIPQVALSVLFGRLTDRIDRRTLCITADLISAATAFALPVWLWMHQSTTLGSYLCNLLLACSATLFMPASNALVKERIRDDLLVKYNARYEMATNAGMLMASSLAGFLVVMFGATPLFVFNSGTFVASAACPVRSPTPAIIASIAASESLSGKYVAIPRVSSLSTSPRPDGPRAPTTRFGASTRIDSKLLSTYPPTSGSFVTSYKCGRDRS